MYTPEKDVYVFVCMSVVYVSLSIGRKEIMIIKKEVDKEHEVL